MKNEPEVDYDMLLVSDYFYTLNKMSIEFKNQTLLNPKVSA